MTEYTFRDRANGESQQIIVCQAHADLMPRVNADTVTTREVDDDV